MLDPKEKRLGYKKTKLGWIPNEWNILKINDVGKVVTGGTPNTNQKEYWNNDHLWFTPSDINLFLKFADSSKRRISNEGLKNSSATLFPKGTIMVCTRATIGELAISKYEASTNQGFKNLIVNDKNDVEYIFYLLRQYKNVLIKLSSGSTFLELSTNDFRTIKLAIPPIQEQKAIANCLSTWDIAIEKQTQLIQAKQTQKNALMQQLLTGKKRLPGFTEEWEEKSLTYFLEYTPRPITKPNIPFTKLGIRSHCKGTFQNKNFKPEAIAIDKLFEVKKNDLIVNITFAWEGAIAIVKQEDDGGLVSHRFPTYTFKKNIGSSLFFEQFIKTKRFRFLLELISPGGAGRNRVMSKKDFLKLKITIPEYKEQTAIANILNTADKEIELLQVQLQQLQQQKKGLMQQLLTGKKRLKY
ncbi:restriction endonuclease subunit S [Tenacibaculum holothuriorum]|uniref:restriction endonuclease subunit S n=1 Tax=Tenacibaculum holothuriorum TaxID=1635173 RepID=UPI000A320AC2|nr:restriction endonuclease subunit S [Tenacibaculum holothuriorum]